MSIRVTKQFSDNGNEETIDVDVTPVMNMFIILIPFLISMAVFTQMSILSFSVPPDAGSGLDQSNGKPKLKITIVVANEYLAITHGEEMLDSIPASNDNQTTDILLEKLKTRRSEIEVQDEAVIAVRDAVKFQNMVRVMDACRSAGFQKIGLSSATADAAEGVQL
jgi:biopolymer transport protein ExbD